MENSENKFINEEVSDETIKDVYKSVFKKKGISVKNFVIEHDREEEVDYFHITTPTGIHFWVKWPSNMNRAYLVSVVNKQESDMEIINNPNANTLVDSMVLEYNKLIKKQNILKQLLSLILEGSEDSNRNPLL